MDFSHLNTVADCDNVITTLRLIGQEPPQELLDYRKNLEKQEAAQVNSETPIWDILKANYPYGVMPEEKVKCVEDMVEHLLSEEPNATDPTLLLGNIQCGKTDTFEDIIGLGFDRGFDVAIVLQKGTIALLNQTVSRMKRDYRFFKPDDNLDRVSIQVHDVHNIRRGLPQALVDRSKTVIVAMKQAKNLSYIIDLLTDPQKNSQYLRNRRVLIVDDEADFASINFRSVAPAPQYDENGNLIAQERITEQAIISSQIDQIRNLLGRNCRYMQVTATPYCLFLQPNGELNLNGRIVQSFRPRFTALVPIHSKYVGGEHYFEKSKNVDSMYSHLFRPVEQRCLDVMKKVDKRYLNNTKSSPNIRHLLYALVSYIAATAIRSIQRREKENRRYSSSAIIHVEVDRNNHNWQYQLVDRLIKDIKKAVVDGETDAQIDQAIDNCYDDFEMSIRKGCEEGLINENMPSKEAMIKEMAQIINSHNLNVQVVNSDNDVSSMLDEETGELKIEHTANIFIGGNILDRGITIKNMLCFFYGRVPHQQDTVLQHARFYGPRDLEDMAVTRLHTSQRIYAILERMHSLDKQLRLWFLNGNDQNEQNAVFVGYDSNFKPCAANKIKASNTLLIKPQSRVLPVGFWTGTRKETQKTMEIIDNLIESLPGYNQKTPEGFFEMDVEDAMKIIALIGQTYVYDANHENEDRRNDINELLCVLDYCTQSSDGKLYGLHRTNRNMSRLRSDNGGFIDAPDDGRSDLAPSRAIAKNKPVLMLIRENGNKDNRDGINYGWNNAPFYWPVLLPQQNLDIVMYALTQRNAGRVAVVDIEKFLAPIKPEEVLSLTYAGDLEKTFGVAGTEYSNGCGPVETRALKKTTAGRYILKGDDGKFLLADGVKGLIAEVYSRNGGNFPFVLKPWRYMLLRNGRSANCNLMLLELTDPKYWNTFDAVNFNEDGDLLDVYPVNTPIDEHDVLMRTPNPDEVDNHLCEWIISYRIKKVLKYRSRMIVLNDIDTDK